MTDFLANLKQRKLVQWALAYIAAAFALIQVLDVVADSYHWPDHAMHVVFGLLVLGLVVTLVLAWYHGEKGRQRVSGAELLLIALVLAIGGGLLWRFGRSAPSPIAGTTQVAIRSPDAAQRNPGNVVPDSVAGATSSGLRVGGLGGAQRNPGNVARDSVAGATSSGLRVGSPGAAPLNPGTIAAQPIPAKSVAVLPLVNESGDKDQQYFSDGLSEDLINALSQSAGLKVISRDSSFRFRNSNDSSAEIGAKLGVAHLLEGSVQKLGDEVRISTELVNCSDGSTLWSQHYDRPYKDLFALQDAITQSVAGALKAKLLEGGDAVVQSDRPPSGNLAAYNDVLQGRFYAQHDTEADMRKAIGYYTDATRLDPAYALAWAYVGNAKAVLAGNYLGGAGAVRTWNAAHTAVEHALRLDPNQPFGHAVYAFILSAADHDWIHAEAEAQRAYQLNPDKAYFALAQARGTLGQAQQAVDLLQRGLSTDPLCSGCYDYLARYLPALGEFDDAAQAARKALLLDPEGYFSAVQLVYIEVMRGDVAAALRAAQQLPPSDWRDLAMAMALQAGDNHAAADAALQKVIARQAGYAAYQIAEAYALRRDPDDMFKWLDRASENRDPGVTLLLTDPPVLRYRNDPRFTAFCKKVGLPTTTDAKALQ